MSNQGFTSETGLKGLSLVLSALVINFFIKLTVTHRHISWSWHSVTTIFYCSYIETNKLKQPASVAQLDVGQTGYQDVWGSTPPPPPPRSATLEIFSAVILALLLIQEGQLSVSGGRMCTVLFNCVED